MKPASLRSANSGGNACAPRNVATRRGTSAIVAMRRDQVEQRGFAGLVQRVAGLAFRASSFRARASYATAGERSFVECRRIEQRFARPLDRVEHAERRLARRAAARQNPARDRRQTAGARARRQSPGRRRSREGRVRSLVAASTRARHRHAWPDRGDATVFDEHRGVVDAAQRIEIDAALRGVACRR